MNKHGTKLSKLDSFLISDDVYNLLPHIQVTALDRLWSDHIPILLHCNKRDFGPVPFKIYHSWFNREAFDDLIISELSNLRSLSSHEKLKALKPKIKQWYASMRSNEYSQKNDALKAIKTLEDKIEEGSASNEDCESQLKLLHDLDKLDTLEAMDYFQKGHIKWDVEGDENTKFFHCLINKKHICNSIKGIMHEGAWVTDPQLANASMEEVKDAVWDCGSDKAPGLDGKMPLGSNSSFITLIPKVSNPINVNDFRPISLIGTHYKIIAKVLANRLSKVVDNLISHEQLAFIKSLQILDGPLILSEAIDWYKKRKKKMLLFKVDFEKAFDSVSWRYLDYMLCKLGDPLSPFLFIIIMEALHVALTDSVRSGLICGINFGSPDLNLSHLFFADDVIITTDWNMHDLDNVIRIFKVFFIASSLKINIHKSSIYGIRVASDDVQIMAANTGCSAGTLPLTYLGLPIGSNMSLIVNRKPLVDKFCLKLSSWKANLLSYSGRLTLIKAVLGSLGIYFFSLFKAPVAVLKALESARASFFWGGGSTDSKKLSWVKWSNVLASLDKGGLAIGSLNSFNLALLHKWRWRFFASPDSLWVKIIKALHGNEGGFDLHGCNFRGIWSKIVGTSNYLHSSSILPMDSIRFQVGYGSLIRFWKDIWLGNSPLYTRFTRLFRLEQDKDCLVMDQEISHIEVRDNADKCFWSLDPNGSFSVADLRRLINDCTLLSLGIKTTWDKSLPCKENNAFFRPLDREARKYGDYVCFNVFEICEELRKNNPDLFDERKPKDIAMEIIRELEFENTDMISKHSIQLHDIGVITFKLHGSWIAKRVEKMFNDGIDTCAPVIYESEARAVFLSRTNTQLIPVAADMLRADFIKDALARIFLYSGIDILDAGVSPSNNIFEEGQIIRMHERCNKADIMVYITPDLQREHIQHCFTAARSSKSRAALACCGYRSFIRNPEEELSGLWQHYYLPRYPSVSKLAEDAGYSREGFFVCALKFSFLKRHRLAECIFDIDEILNEEGNTFRYVLNTRALICSVIKNPRGTCWFELKEALAGKEERELGFHLVQFTGLSSFMLEDKQSYKMISSNTRGYGKCENYVTNEYTNYKSAWVSNWVIEKACAGLVPNFVCDYLCDLSKLFTSYYSKVRPGKEPILGLCKAAEVVMDKCFDLLGIAPEIIRELEFENTDMISKHSIQLHDIGVITFKLHGSWIAKRVEKMFNDGIDTCAPAARSSKSRAALAICGYRVHKEPRRRAFCFTENEEGSTFRYVLNTRALICSVIKNPRGTCWFESKEAFAGKEERELGFHLVQVTGVRPGKEPILGLCKAAEVVMDKCFDLLGIAPGFSQVEILSSERRGPCRELAETSNQQMKQRRQIRVKIKIRKEAIISKGNLMSTQSSQENNAFFRPLDGEARKYGEYVCLNVFEICEELRKNNPDLFDERKPKDIAMIAKRVEKMFNDGIDTCAPTLNEEGNTFRCVLNTRALICSVTKNPGGTCWFESKEALAGKEERELGFHLVQFTGLSSFMLEDKQSYKMISSNTRGYGKCENYVTNEYSNYKSALVSNWVEILSSERRGPCRQLAETR
ncbi:putative RNA-directed DNA polymerase, eukaryota, reverse transcriptase zinc-binding domain protein [Tanacetum coccineum]|uniref:RNA-directed DNA polymerase, eukaryota, reverse transcriptase zinc-binding domain protein n=1 Tax=Tanacetum coccineum TaxID=301880 RepID=A0ABQ5DDA0_9ASTR